MKRANSTDNRARYNSDRYYMHTANALAPDYDLEQPLQRETAPQKKKAVITRRHFVLQSIPGLARVACVFCLAIILVGQYIYIQGLGYEVSQTKGELGQTLNDNEKLKQQYAALGDLKIIEAKAIYNLGMIRPDNNVAYLPPKEAETDVAKSEGISKEDALDYQEDVQNGNNVLATIEGLLEIFRF